MLTLMRLMTIPLATRKVNGDTLITHMLHCSLLEGHTPRKFILHPVIMYSIRGCDFRLCVIFFDTGGRLILNGLLVPLYLIRN